MAVFLFLIVVLNLTKHSVNEIFDPDRIDGFYASPADEREKSIISDRATNYGVVRIELIEQIYHDLYMQKITSKHSEDWRKMILPRREIIRVGPTPSSDNRLEVHINSTKRQKNSGDDNLQEEILHLDALVVATGYTRNTHERLCAPIEHLRPPTTKKDKGPESSSNSWKVNRDYSLLLDPDKVSADAGIWLQGCNETTHGISDSLLSVLATRSGELVESIFGKRLSSLRVQQSRKGLIRHML